MCSVQCAGDRRQLAPLAPPVAAGEPVHGQDWPEPGRDGGGAAGPQGHTGEHLQLLTSVQ